MKSNWVVNFKDGNPDMKALLGEKGVNLAEMTQLGLPVPPGFTITTDACRNFYALGRLPGDLMNDVNTAMHQLEQTRGLQFGDAADPLLVSVRSGAVHSMPGMMDTILNLGLNDETVQGLAQVTNNERFAYDCYRRLIHMFGTVVFNVTTESFEHILQQMKKQEGVTQDQDLSAAAMKLLVHKYKQCFEMGAGYPFPQNVHDQLKYAVKAVFRSWNNYRAQIYRKLNHIPDEQGTAVNIQSMVFGNRGDDSGTGVVFTRHPSTGQRSLFGEYLVNAQGEDVVAGSRTPEPINSFAQKMPELFDRIQKIAEQLENKYLDMQDIEFTVERGQLYVLQTRSGKRTAQAAVTIAVNLVHEGIITKDEALLRMEVEQLAHLLHPSVAPDVDPDVIANGLPASPGAATGQIVFDANEAEELARQGVPVILIRPEATPEDIHGVLTSQGVLTSKGGMTSHAAVVARSMGKPCVCACDDVQLDRMNNCCTIGNHTFKKGDLISIDGTTGRVMKGKVPLSDAAMSAEFTELLEWADEVRELQVYANADTPEDAVKARMFGAEGIGLCRTEHMFMAAHRLHTVQQMILASTEEERRKALDKLLPMQQFDFEGIFEAMDGLPVTIRLLDPPLHEFLPNLEELVIRQTNIRVTGEGTYEESNQLDELISKVRTLQEANPMLGQRGCRLGMLFPDIYEMQIEAVFRAAKKMIIQGVHVIPEIMVPLVGHANELRHLRQLVDRVAEQVLGIERRNCSYRIGTMIEVPRAALTANQIAQHADFFSFGTNDLTQMTYGCSRDDAEGKFLAQYVERKVLPSNPFQELDIEGVGQLIDWAVSRGRAIKPSLKTGICGEHGGERKSIFFCHESGLNYVSCSPYRIPLARIAAAQAVLTLGTRELELPQSNIG